MARDAERNPDAPLVAGSIWAGLCGSCGAVHLVLFDAEGAAIATAAMTQDQWATAKARIDGEILAANAADGGGVPVGRA